ncbi:Hypothetical predicted protein [Pelobates cultripes]|uniref:Uncharacterized protein n=1 Tax=Pelobates cultripes TaxID=61616 RepID=A0AAD1RYC9_PELCU|nr:Hypothetical predicted protein [Pelobates cultripes]
MDTYATHATQNRMQVEEDEQSTSANLTHQTTDLSLPLQTGLKPKSTFTPCMVNESIGIFSNLVKRDIKKLRKKSKNRSKHLQQTPNFTKKERLILNNLKQDDSIIIQSADKGGALVIMDQSYYVKEIRTQLNDTESYKLMDRDPTHSLQTTLQGLNKDARHKGIIYEGEYRYINRKHPTIPVFYTLPKINKNPQFPPCRPVVSGKGSVLQPPAEILDKFLIYHVPMQKSSIKDTNDFLKLIENFPLTEQDDIWLVTLDVQFLHTSIENEG